MQKTWCEYVCDVAESLERMIVSDRNGKRLQPDAAFQRLVRIFSEVRRKRRIVYLAGNGASASIASHFAADMAKNGRMHTQVFTDQSLVTAVSNDISYEDVYSFPLSIRGSKGDIFVGISSSGNSPNIVKAAETARKLKMTTVTLSSMKEGNKLRRLGDFNFYIPAGTYGYAESTHAAVLHHLMDMLEMK